MKIITAVALVLLSMITFVAQVGASDNASKVVKVAASENPPDDCETESDNAPAKTSDKLTVDLGKFTLKGDYFLRCRMELNRRGLKDDSDDRHYYHQRLRTHIFYQVVEEVRVELRADWNEGGWGDDVDNRNGVPDSSNDFDRALQIERALVNFTFPTFDATLGLQQTDRNHIFGLGYLYWPQAAGVSAQLRTPVTFDLSYYKYSEGDPEDETADTLTDSGELETEDVDLYGAQIAYKSKALSVGLFYAAQNNYQTEDNPQAASIWYNGSLGPVQLGVEVDYLFGDNGQGTDYVGNLLFLDAAWLINQTFKIGLHGYYAMGSDKDDEQVITRPGDWSFWGPWVPNIWQGLPGCAWDGIEMLSAPNSFDIIGGNAGEVGGDAYVNVYVGNLEFGVQGYYLEPQEESVTDISSKYGFSAGVAYTWKKTIIFALGGLYATREYEDDDPDRENEPAIGSQALVRVKF